MSPAGITRSHRSPFSPDSLCQEEPPSKKMKLLQLQGCAISSPKQCIDRHLFPDPVNDNTTVVGQTISAIASFLEAHKQKRISQLDQWRENGYVSPGFQLPPIADPELFTNFSIATMDDGSRPEDWRCSETLGDMIYNRCVKQLLLSFDFYRPIVTVLYNAFTSNAYQQKLVSKVQLLACICEFRGLSADVHIKGKAVSNTLEAYCGFGVRDPLYQYTSISFEEYLISYLKSAFLPVLNYVSDFYHPLTIPILRVAGNIPKVEDYPFIKSHTSNFNFLESEAILKIYLVECNRSENQTDPGKGTLFGGSEKHFFHTTLKFRVPTDSRHSFWIEKIGLNQDDWEDENTWSSSTTLEVSAFGHSERDSKDLAMRHLISLLDLMRKLLRRMTTLSGNDVERFLQPLREKFCTENNDQEDLQQIVRDALIPSSSLIREANDHPSDMGIEVAQKLLRTYKIQKEHMRKANGLDSWRSISTFLQTAIDDYSSLRDLLAYYNSYVYLRRRQYSRAAKELISIPIGRKIPRFLTQLINKRLTYISIDLIINPEIPMDLLSHIQEYRLNMANRT